MGATSNNAAARGGHRALAIPQSFLHTPSDANPACDVPVGRGGPARPVTSDNDSDDDALVMLLHCRVASMRDGSLVGQSKEPT